MPHFTTIGELIAEIEAESRRYEGMAKVARHAQSAAVQRGYASACRNIASMMRRTCIGPDRRTAKPLEECR
jgi:hypothetical protein